MSGNGGGQYSVHSNQDVAAAQKLALDLAYPANCQTIQIAVQYKEPRYRWDAKKAKWSKTEVDQTQSTPLTICGPTCPTETQTVFVVEEYEGDYMVYLP